MRGAGIGLVPAREKRKSVLKGLRINLVHTADVERLVAVDPKGGLLN